MNRACERCGVSIEGKPSGQRYCSLSCSSLRHKGCSVDGCSKLHRARGLCYLHWKQEYGKPNRKVEVSCDYCGTVVLKEATSKYGHRFCSLLCRDLWRRIERGLPLACAVPERHSSRSCLVPADHPSRVQRVHRALESRECNWCGSHYQTNNPVQAYCMRRCKKKHSGVRRRGQEAGSFVAYTWSEVMRVFLAFDRCCAYCKQTIDGQPEPDHVVPLSRGGSNSISNILPACAGCNADKRDLLLHEWNADRTRRGLPPRTVEWMPTDPRVAHLRRELRDAA